MATRVIDNPTRPADDHPGRTADDLLGAHSRLHADHLRLHSGQTGLGICQPAGPGDVRPLCRRHRQRARRLVPRQVLFLARRPRPRPSCWNCRTTSCRVRAASSSGLYTRAKMFLQRAGTTIFSMMVVIWFLASFPRPPAGATEPAIDYSLAAMIGQWARTAAGAGRLQLADQRRPDPRHGRTRGRGRVARHRLCHRGRQGGSRADRTCPRQQWSLATALALLVWYIFAPQCASTLAVIRRETGSWRWMAVTFGYMLALAYLGSLITYHLAVAFGAG